MLENQQQNTNEAIMHAMRQVQKRNLRLDEERKEAQAKLEEWNAEVAEERAETARRRQESAPWKGALSGAMSGAGMGAGIAAATGIPAFLPFLATVGGIGGGIMGMQDPDLMYETAPYAAQLGGAGMQYAGQQKQEQFNKDRLEAWQNINKTTAPAAVPGGTTNLTDTSMGSQISPGAGGGGGPSFEHGDRYSSLGTAGSTMMGNFADMKGYNNWLATQKKSGKNPKNWEQALALYGE